MYCKNCGREIPDAARFCKYCGEQCSRLNDVPSYEQPFDYEDVGYNQNPTPSNNIDYDQYSYSGNNNLPAKKGSGKKIILIIGLVLLILAGAFCVWWFVFRDTKVSIDRPTFSVESGTYQTEQNITISTSDNNHLTVYYTTDGSTPGTNSRKYVYGNTIRVSKSMTVKCIAADEKGNTSEVSVGDYIIEKKNQSSSVSKETNKSSTTNTTQSSYILNDSNSRYYSESEIKKMSKKDRCYARNEIYARHGLIFKSQELQNYFNGQSWYKGITTIDGFDTSVFNDYENKNIKTIKAVENAEGEYTLN